MKKFLLGLPTAIALLTWALCPILADAQTYPSPTFNSLTLQNPLTAANGGTGVTTSTGSGSVVLSTSPTLSGPTLSNPVVTGTSTIPYSLTFNNPAANTVAGKLNQIVNLTDYGPHCDGSTNDDTAVSAAITAIGSTPATLFISCPVKIAANHTFGAGTQLDFEANGRIIGTTGTENVQVQQQIIAGPTQIFSNVTPQADVGMTVYPEWFGGTQLAADASIGINQSYTFLVNVGGSIRLGAGTYTIQNPITPKAHVALIGAGQNVTQINVSGTNVNGINIVGTLGSPIYNVVFAGFNLTSSTAGTTNIGIQDHFSALAKYNDIQVNNFFTGVDMECATNTSFERMGVAYTASTNGFTGWNINGGGGCAGGNESSTWRDTYVSGTGAYSGPTGQIGYKAYGAYVSDLYFSNAATAETNYGYSLDYSTATAGGYADVIIHNPVVDGFTLQGILVNALPAQQMLTISDGWINPVSMLAETDGIYCSSCVGSLQVTGVQIGGEANYAYAVGVKSVSSSNVKVSTSAFNDNKYAIQETGSTGNVYSGNSVYNTSAHAGAVDFFLTGSTGAVIANNTLSGYSSFGVQADATSSSVAMLGNTVQGGNITTPVQNNGSSPIGGGYTGTGLSVLQNGSTLIAPNLGTPASATLTNATGLPIATGVSGLGTGVATALGNAVTGSGSIVLGTSPAITTPTITGFTDGSSAAAGKVGEPLAASTSGTSITSGTTVNATSIPLTAGDWNCTGQALFLPAATTVVANISAGLTTTSATLPASPDTTYLGVTLSTGTNGTTALNTLVKPISVSSSTTLYLVANAGSVTTSTATVNGYIRCRRVR